MTNPTYVLITSDGFSEYRLHSKYCIDALAESRGNLMAEVWPYRSVGEVMVSIGAFDVAGDYYDEGTDDFICEAIDVFAIQVHVCPCCDTTVRNELKTMESSGVGVSHV